MVIMLVVYYFFFFKQKTAYEMRISDWSSDVCSSDLACAYAPRRMVASAMIKQTTGYPMAADDSIMFEISIDHIGGPLLFDQLGRMELTMKEFNPQVSTVEALGALADRKSVV